MGRLADSVAKHCPGVPPALLEMHLRRTPESYQERYGPADIARHLRLLTHLSEDRRVEVEVRSLGGPNLEVCVVGYDRTGVLAAITLALAVENLDVQDLQLATYLPAEVGEEVEPTFFVDVVRVSCGRRGVAVTDIARGLRDRLTTAVMDLAAGNLPAAETSSSADNSTPVSPPRAPLPAGVNVGMVLDGFRLEERLAAGAMSEVFLATQLNLQRKAAVKVIIEDADSAAELTTRFARETQVLAGFSCPYIVPVLAAGTTPLANATVRWMAMEHLPHGDLKGWLKRNGPATANLAVRWFQQALQGLHYAHQRGILHRDLKPQNLLLTADGDVKLCDFGLLKRATHEDVSLTLHGSVMGTPQYISPEQAVGDDADERSDLYSLGATFFHLLSGRLPFEDLSSASLLLRISREDAPSLVQVAPGVARPLGVMITRLLARRPEERYQSAHVVLEDLRSYLQRGLLSVSDEIRGPIASPLRRSPEATQVLQPPTREPPGL